MSVARNVASLIPDGATLQPGIGGISEAVLHCLEDKHDLGIHTEMCPDGVVDLMEAGVINGERKSLHRGKAVAAFVLGTQRLFDYIHENPSFEFRSISYTNDPFVVAQNDRMVAINSALQSGSDRAGVRRFARHQALQRLWRPDRFHSRRGAVARRSSDYRVAFDGMPRAPYPALCRCWSRVQAL